MSREILLQSVIFNVARLRIEQDGAPPIIRDVVEHPGASVILPVLDDGGIVMIRNRRFTVGKTLWELPAGTLEAGESPSDCAARELEEETGYRAANIDPLTEFFASPGVLTERLYGFVATELTATAQSLDPTEEIEVHPTPVEHVVQMLRRGEIEDGKTVTMLLYWLRFGRRSGC